MKKYLFLLILLSTMNLCRGDTYADSLKILSMFYGEIEDSKIEKIFLEHWLADSQGENNELGYFRLLEHYLPLLIVPQGDFPNHFYTLNFLAPAYLNYAELSGKPVTRENRLAAAFFLKDPQKFRSIYEDSPVDSIAKKHLGAWAFLKYKDPFYEPAWKALLQEDPVLALRGVLLLSNAELFNGNTILRDEFQRNPEIIDSLTKMEKYILLMVLVPDHLSRFPEKWTIEDFRTDPLSGVAFSHLEKQLDGVTVGFLLEDGKLANHTSYRMDHKSTNHFKIEIQKKEDLKKLINQIKLQSSSDKTPSTQ